MAEISAATPMSPHVIAIPYPAQGHFSPMLQLCEQLASRGFSVTFINTHHIHHRLLRASKLLPDISGACPLTGVQCDPREDAPTAASPAPDFRYHYNCKEGGCIRMIFVTGGAAPELHANNSTMVVAFHAAQEMREPVERLLPGLMNKERVSFFMSDTFLAWGSDVAEKFGLPWVAFWSVSSASLSAYVHFSGLIDTGDAEKRIAEMQAEGAPLLDDIPGLPPTRLADIPKIWAHTTTVSEVACRMFKVLAQASSVLVNTFADIEGPVVEALSRLRYPVRAVGPLLPSLGPHSSQSEALISSRPSLFAEDRACLAWLDTQAAGSVLYISFGSISLRSEEQMQELAKGVEASGCPFLWVWKPADVDGALQDSSTTSPGAAMAGKPRGLFVPWAPQLQVLSHPAVGGFITHCGWNSVVESVCMGVPMLCWADTDERMCNQRFAVEVWKCGVYMVGDMERRRKQHIDDGAVLVSREDVEKSIRLVMLDEGGAELRHHSAQLRDAAIKAYGQELDKFAETMKRQG